MGKVTIIIESETMSTSELENQCQKVFSTKSIDYLLPEDREVIIVPSDD